MLLLLLRIEEEDDDNVDDSRLCSCWKELVANYVMCLLVLACFCVN